MLEDAICAAQMQTDNLEPHETKGRESYDKRILFSSHFDSLTSFQSGGSSTDPATAHQDQKQIVGDSERVYVHRCC